MTTRRGFLSGIAAAGAAWGCPALIGPALAADAIAFTTPQVFDPTFIDIMNAYSGGHFAQQGLDCKVLGPPGSAAGFQLVLGGQAQFGYIAAPDLIRAVGARRAPLQAIATIGQRIGFRIVSLAAKPLRTGADLRGKTIGVVSVGGLSEDLVDVVMIADGVAPREAMRVTTGNSPGEVELLRQGRLDGFICNFQVAYMLQQSKQDLEFIDVDKVLPAPGGAYYTTREMIDTKPDVVLRTLRAMKASVEELLAGPLPPIFRRAAKDFEIPRMNDLDTLVAVQQAIMEHLWLAEGRQNLLRNVPALWQSGVDGMRKAAIADVKDASALYTNRFLDEIAKG